MSESPIHQPDAVERDGGLRARPVRPPHERVRVLLVEDHAVVREGLAAVLEHSGAISVAGQASGVRDGLRLLREEPVDVVLLDLRLGEEHGVELVREVRRQDDGPAILVLSAQDATLELERALAAGANGYLLKGSDATTVTEAVLDTAAGRTVIDSGFVPKLLNRAAHADDQPTARELEVLRLCAEGATAVEIAEALEISPRTAQKHIERLFKKLGVSNRAELVSAAFRRGLVR